MGRYVRFAGAVLAGLLIAFLLVLAVEMFSNVVHPLPPDFKGTIEEVCQHVARYPDWVLAVAGAAWVGAAFVSTRVAGWIGNRGPALVVGLLLVAGVLLNLAQLPYALWFKVAMAIAVPAAVLAAVYLSGWRAVGALPIVEKGIPS